MNKISLNFFGEEVSIQIPNSLTSLRKEIADKFMFNASDAAEIVLSYMKDFGKKIIQTEQDFANFLANKIAKIDLDISQDSKLYLQNLNSIQKENEEAKKELDECLQKKVSIKTAKEECLKEEMIKMKEIERKIRILLKQKTKLAKKMKEDKANFDNQEKENNQKISTLKEKLGIKEEKKKKIIKKRTILKANKAIIVKGSNGKKEVHPLVTCDGCQMSPIVGKRYKCECCPNFDFCEECYKKNKEKHGHNFKEVETKALIKQLLNRFVPKAETKEGKPIHLMCTCDGCGKNPIIGPRFKCKICPEFNYCETCMNVYKNEHYHPFDKTDNPNMNI